MLPSPFDLVAKRAKKEGIEEGRTEGREEGRAEERKNILSAMRERLLAHGMSIEEINEILALS